MTLKAEITRIKRRWHQGREFIDVAFMDTNPVNREKFIGEINLFRPEPTDIQALNLNEGCTCTLKIQQVMEIRNGAPVVRAQIQDVKQPTQKAA